MRITAFSSVALLATMLAACGGATADGAGGSSPKKLEIYSWFLKGSDATAFSNLIYELKKRYPGIQVDNARLSFEAGGSREIAQRIANGDPPDAFQVVPGAELRTWAVKDVLAPLDNLSAEQGWEQVFPEKVLDAARTNGALFGVTLGLERDNTLFYNKAVLQKLGVPVPSSVAEFFDAAAAIKGQGMTPLAVSSTGGWTIASHFFDALLIAEAGPDFVESYFAGQKTADAPEVRAALTDLARMMDYANDDRATTSWGDAVGKVCRDEAAMLFLPDFVRGQFESVGCGPDKIGYVAIQPAGTPTFVFVGIGFTFPKNPPHPESAIAFAEVAASAEGQRVFNLAKGNIPARIDVPAGEFDPISQMTMKDFAASGERHVLSYSVATSGVFQEAINPALQLFVDPSSSVFKSVDGILVVLRQNYWTIAR
jgi:glucose/mannose transport system substrate-binding protein